jgi:hypothetical protein
MMIDIEVVEKRSNNYLPLLFLLLGGFLITLKKILYNIGLVKMKSLSYKNDNIHVKDTNNDLFDTNVKVLGELKSSRKVDAFITKDENVNLENDKLKKNTILDL